MRVLLLILLVNGLLPALGEAVEDVAHHARTGHVAHCADDAGAPCDGGREHGCSNTEHHCICCPGMPALPLPRSLAGIPSDNPTEMTVASVESPNARALEPPFRPPIV